MKVALFTDADVFAGTERHMLDLALALRQIHVNVMIACPRPGALASRADAIQIPVLEIPKRGHIDRNAIHILSQKLIRREVDIIHAHNGRTHIAAAFAVKKAGRGVCIATQHFLAPARTQRSGPKSWVSRYLHWRAEKFTAHTIAISHAVRTAALARGEARPDSITTVHNGSSAPDISALPAPAVIRSSLAIDADDLFIFCAARLEPEKDIHTLIAAMKIVTNIHPNVRCLIAGDGSLRAALQQQINQLELQNVVTLLGFRNDVPALLQSADLFVLPSLAEPFGLVLLEAMALAKPVIATNIGGPPEIVIDGQTGMLVPPSDPQSLATAIVELIANPEKRQGFGLGGYQRYLEYFNLSRMARETLTIYEHSISPPKLLSGIAPVSVTKPFQCASSMEEPVPK